MLESNISPNKLTEDDWTKAEFKCGPFNSKIKAQSSTSVPGAIRLRFDKDKFFQRYGNVYLRPVKKNTFREIYQQELAKHLGLPVTGWELVNLKINGADAGLFIANEKPDEFFMEKQGITGVAVRYYLDEDTKDSKRLKCDDKDLEDLLRTGFDDMHHNRTDALCQPVEPRKLAALALVRALSGQPLLPHKLEGYFQTTSGRVLPVYQPEADQPAATVAPEFYDVFASGSFKMAFNSQLTALRRNTDDLRVALAETEDALKAHASKIPVEISSYAWLLSAIAEEKDHLASYRSFEKVASLQRPQYPCHLDRKNLEKLAELLLFRIDGDTLRTEASATISADYPSLVVPPGYTWVFEAGAELNLGEGVSILSWSPIAVRGTKEQPVKIRAAGEKPFGSLLVVGNGRSMCKVQYLELSGGSEGTVDGIFCPGALGLFHTNVQMDGCTFSNNRADDGLNVKYGHVELSNCTFAGNFADQVDLDFCQGTVRNCTFAASEGDSNGDGLDISGSQLSVKECQFRGFADKGLSIGEQSRAEVEKCTIRNCNTGIAVKDLSVVFSRENLLANCQMGYHIYRKKQAFGPASLYWIADKQQDCKKVSVTEEGSRHGPLNSWDARSWQKFEATPK